ncbi:MAG: Ig-like domain-containing protein, partial [Monoglobaceae bacterium]
MNRKVFGIRQTAILLLALMLTVSSVYPMYVCAESDVDDKIIYKASDAWSDSMNTDSVWRWLYRNNQTKDTETPYSEYSIAKAGNSADFAAPQENEDGTYNYNVSGSTDVIVYSDSTANPGMRNAMGRYWVRPSVATGSEPKQSRENRIVKQFTAPKSGRVVISAEDMSGAAKIYNRNISGDSSLGAVLIISKRGADGTDKELWKHTFSNGPGSVEALDFADVECELNVGDKLWFEVSGETGGSAYAKLVFWNPVVIYSYEPESVEPSDLTAVALDQVFTVTFPDEIEAISADCVSVSGKGSPSVTNFSQSRDMRSISFSFDGLNGDSEYSVIVKGIKTDGYSAELRCAFSFVTEHVFEYPEYKASDAWSDSTNTDSVWRWLYRNNQTKDTKTPYAEYKITGTGDTEEFSAPARNDDGTYDYASLGKNKTVVFADSAANPGRRNAVGRYWARVSTATGSEPKQSSENRIVKQFSAPESGRVVISAEDMSGDAKIYNKGLEITGNRLNGAVVRIIKKTDDESEEILFEHDFAYTGSADCPEDGVGIYDFENIECELKVGDKLWFEISGETGGSAYAKLVFWDPTVKYKALYPNIVKSEPESGTQGVAPNFEHRIKFDREIIPVSAESIEVDGGAKCENAWLEDENTTLCLTYSGLAENTEYNIKINDVRMQGTSDGLYRTYDFSFKTGDMVQIGYIYTDKALSAGNNTVR